MKVTPMPEIETNHLDFAAQVLGNRRSAVNLTVRQIQDMAAVILVLDHDVTMARERIATMLSETAGDAKGKEEGQRGVVCVPVANTGSSALNATLTPLIAEYQRLEKEKYGPGENLARQRFEKAATEVVKICLLNRKETRK